MERSCENSAQIDWLREQIARRSGWTTHDRGELISSGYEPLDRMLPEGGFRRGTLVEWLGGDGSPVGTLAAAAARAACRDAGALVVLDRRGEFYPPAAVGMGIGLEKLIVVHADTAADHVWALDQSLRCSGVAAVLAWIEKLDGRTFRRLQLAAEASGVLGLLIRPGAVRQEPSWADVRLLVEPLPSAGRPGQRRARIHLLRCRGVLRGRSLDVEFDDETHAMHLVAQLADSTSERRAAGA